MDIKDLIKSGTFERIYRKSSLSVSLNPALAFALNHLAGLDKNDRILDPFCGAATILIERQLLKPALCVGVDIDPRALDCARENIEAFLSCHPDSDRNRVRSEGSIELRHGDIRERKFPDNYFTKIISNLPYGIHSGSREQNLKLYKFITESAIKWLKVGGRAVLLTSSKNILRNSFAKNTNWLQEEEIPFQSGGLDLSVFIYQRMH